MYQQIDAGLALHHVENPEFMGLHYMTAAEVEEAGSCRARTSCRSPTNRWRTCRPIRRLAAQDWTPAYQRHRRNFS